MLKVRHSASHVQLHYHCDLSELRGVSVPFPSTEGLIDHKQIQYTKRILDSIQRGLLLEVGPMGIYGFRQDKCNVFVSTSNPAEIQNPVPKKLVQNCKELLFSFDKYKKGKNTLLLRTEPQKNFYFVYFVKNVLWNSAIKHSLLQKLAPKTPMSNNHTFLTFLTSTK